MLSPLIHGDVLDADAVADSPTHFGMAHNVRELEKTFKHLDDHPKIAMACINDDQPAGSGDEAARNRWRRINSWVVELGRNHDADHRPPLCLAATVGPRRCW